MRNAGEWIDSSADRFPIIDLHRRYRYHEPLGISQTTLDMGGDHGFGVLGNTDDLTDFVRRVNLS
jgi:hypothetical protein